MANKRAFNEKARQIAQNPKVQEAFKSMKPQKSLWGILGVIIFFILPEIIAYIWGAEITQYAKAALLLAASFAEAKSYELLIMLFEDGMSWFNLLFGLALLVWLFF
ncbi:MAG: hypothetical protein PHR87_01320 [Sulfurospirillaceae bacterium]|nr:hypothetical protein [Sulfurospirillaceae bacterium]